LLTHDFIHYLNLYHHSSLYIFEEYHQSSLIHSLNLSTSVDLMSGSYHSSFTIERLMLHQETTHEYYMGSDPSIYYCEDHDTLIVVKDGSDRVLLNGLTEETMLKFARKLVQEDLDKTLAKYESKDAAEITSEA